MVLFEGRIVVPGEALKKGTIEIDPPDGYQAGLSLSRRVQNIEWCLRLEFNVKSDHQANPEKIIRA